MTTTMTMNDQRTPIPRRVVKIRRLSYREKVRTSIHSLLLSPIGEKTDQNNSSDDDELITMMRRVRVSKRSRRKKPRQRGTMAPVRSSSRVPVPVPAPVTVSMPMPVDGTVSLVGQGRDASYDYRDTFMVQAIMKTFNGATSATRVVDDFVACHGRRQCVVASQQRKEEERRCKEEAEREMVS